jgi:hypothetical protein
VWIAWLQLALMFLVATVLATTCLYRASNKRL